MFAYKTCRSGNSRATETATAIQAYRLEPEFCDIVIPFNMNVRRFALIARIKEKPVASPFSGLLGGLIVPIFDLQPIHTLEFISVARNQNQFTCFGLARNQDIVRTDRCPL